MTDVLARPLVAVGAVVWNAADEVLLIRRGKPPRAGSWSIPGGKVEWGEGLAEALVREVREETGITVDVVGLIEVLDSRVPGPNGEIAHHHVLIDYTARALSSDVRAGDDAADARFVKMSELGAFQLWSETLRIIRKSAEQLGIAGR